MPDHEPTIGERLRSYRRQRALTQEELAERAGVSRDLVRKLEQGQRSTARITSLVALANALDIDLSDLVGSRPQLDGDGDGTASILALRDALLTTVELPGAEPDDHDPAPAAVLTSRLDAAWRAYWDGAFGRVVADLPGVIDETRHAHRHVGLPDAMARAYHLAANMASHLGRDELAAIAAERALRAAEQGGDELRWATLHATYAWVLLRQGRVREAEEHAVRVAGRVEPDLVRSPPQHVAVWGSLLMTATASAACDPGRTSAATEYISLARTAATRIGSEREDYETSFGPVQVAVQTVHTWSKLREPGRAIPAAREVQPGALKPVVYGRHLLDVAEAWMDARKPTAAVATLQQARDVSSTWFRNQGLARSLVTDLVDTERRLTPALRSLARTVNVA